MPLSACSSQTAPCSDVANNEDWFYDIAVRVTAALCRQFEGLHLKPYLCPAGIPTIGYGSTYYLDGRLVKLTDPPITKETAEVMLLHLVRYVYLPAVVKLCPGVTDPYQLAALIDFAFNLGIGRLQTSTLRRRVNAGQWSLVPTEFRKWIMAAGKKLKGLILRREAEIKTAEKGNR